jgi:hypothetical protein
VNTLYEYVNTLYEYVNTLYEYVNTLYEYVNTLYEYASINRMNGNILDPGLWDTSWSFWVYKLRLPWL